MAPGRNAYCSGRREYTPGASPSIPLRYTASPGSFTEPSGTMTYLPLT